MKGHYSGVLPALNTVLDLTDDVLLRFSATQNLNRPGLGSMAAQGSAFQGIENCNPATPGADCDITVSRGNPNLKPYKDNTLDFAVEYYFGKVGLLSAGVYQKSLTNFITSVPINNIPFSETGVPSGTIPGATDSTLVREFDMPVNHAGTIKLSGVEVAAQTQLSFLPAPFDNLGVIANYSYVDAPSITGISKTSYNATLYYDTALWGARASMSHRSKWFSGYDSNPMSAGNQGYDASTYVDAAAFYNVTPHLRLTFDAINLTNQKDTQFWGQNEYLYNQTQSGTTYMIGLGYKF